MTEAQTRLEDIKCPRKEKDGVRVHQRSKSYFSPKNKKVMTLLLY